VRLVTVDLDEPLRDIPTGGASWLHVTALHHGRPVAVVTMSAPLDPAPREVVADALERAIAPVAVRHQVEEALVRRPEPRMGETAVVVCTRDRPADLARCLASLARLDPAPDEVVVVDNGDDGATTQRIVAEHGFRYVHESVPGLDRARNRGIASTTHPVVLFTDDDVTVHPQWAARLAEAFDDPLVAAATGLVLPASLDPPERWEFERQAGFSRGLRRLVLDGSTTSPYRAGNVGAGASMAFRRPFLLGIGGFPEALDAGTPTQSGGDTYALARALTAGLRVVYEPRAIAWHLHRATPEALERVLRGYGTGIVSYLAQMAVDTRDPAVVLEGFRWTAQYLGKRFRRAAVRLHQPRRLALARAEVAGAFAAPAAYRRSRRIAAVHTPIVQRNGHGDLDPGAVLVEVAANGHRHRRLADGDALPRLSVVIPTRGRRDQVLRLLRALDVQEYPRERLDVVVCVDGDVDGTADAVTAAPLEISPTVVVLPSPSHDRHVGNGAAAARNAGAARATGDVIVFLDDDVVPAHSRVLAAHGRVHIGEDPVVAVGPLVPVCAPVGATLGRAARNWWIDHTRRVVEARDLDFTDVSSGNCSVSHRLFRQVGGFTSMPRREDWEFGYRAEQAGARVVAAPGAAVTHDVEADPVTRLRDRYAEGAGDAVFARRHPAALLALPLAGWEQAGRRTRWIVRAMVGRTAPLRLTRLVAPLLQIYEILGLRERYSSLLGRLGNVCYWLGAASEVPSPRAWNRLFATATGGAARAEPLDLASGDASWRRSPGAGVVPLAWAGVDLDAAVPVQFAGVPWNDETFARYVAELGRGPLLSHLVGTRRP